MGLLTGLSADTIESRLINTLEVQLIHPVLRSYKAYQYSISKKECAKYALCVVESTGTKRDVGLRPAVAKASS